jgi:hypothetical protein
LFASTILKEFWQSRFVVLSRGSVDGFVVLPRTSTGNMIDMETPLRWLKPRNGIFSVAILGGRRVAEFNEMRVRRASYLR